MAVRDISIGETIDIKFSTRAFATGAPTTLAGTPVISAYPGNSTTQLTAGITLTVDFDSVTGLHNIRVVATTGNGYATATDYALVITTGTVGGVSVVGEVVGEFTIGRSAAATRVGLLTATAATGDPGTTVTVIGYLKQLVNVLVGTAGITTWAAGAAPANAVSLSEALRYISNNLGAVGTTAATGDPDTAKTGMGYLKQLVNVLVGTAGVTTYPAAAAPGNAVSLSEVLRSIYDDTNSLDGTKVPDTISLAAINAEVDTAFTTQMADSVPADGTIATREQALYMLLQILSDFSISGTTMTVKKVDGSTTLFTLTLDDSANPTSITRAT